LATAWIMTRDMHEPKFRAFMDDINGDLNRTVSSRSADAWRTALESLAQTRGA
jgi:hypothetical protein